MKKTAKIYVAGHNGMVGSAIVRRLQEEDYKNLVLRTHDELDLLRQKDVEEFFRNEKPEYVFVAAAKVGGILANDTYRAEFIYENLQIQNNIIHNAYKNGAKKLIFLGSSCIYPKHAPQPMKEEYLLTGELEKTNEPYAIAKIAGIKMCENYYRQYGSNFFSVMPTNLYGPNDNFDLETSHVLPALIRKFHEATHSTTQQLNNSTVTLWGTGEPKREFLHVDDMADACVYLMKTIDASQVYNKDITHINIGVGEDISINNLAGLIADIVGFEGQIEHDTSKPDGTPRKLLDVSWLHELGWEHSISLKEGIQNTYDWYLENVEKDG
ncbi:MAG: GDP-L-fucose synthase [Candidatus Marinimicrobia bacterium]|nr:GDP-L-fucose synthase [Candidatus Neomarinimicrobiota bacterium]MCF7828762.1 GDP-L-fucose synthase [Candidatus Neomarinimicrobiota bacterium]MCF7880679.1 GDP-L-fucose synthase [Candidatus Neomarinimicrobiota bacterium]